MILPLVIEFITISSMTKRQAHNSRTEPNVFTGMQRGKVLENWTVLGGHYLIAIDGTGTRSSHKVKCEKCCVKHHHNGSTTYFHQMLGAAMIHPELLISIQGSPTFSAHFGPTSGRNGSWGKPPPGQPDLLAANQSCWPFRRCLMKRSCTMKRSFYNK